MGLCSAKDHAEQSHAEQLADLPKEMLAALDDEMKQSPQMDMGKVLGFYFTDKMLATFDYSQEVSTLSHMFNDADMDNNGKIDWKEWPLLDQHLAEFDSGFYAHQNSMIAKKAEDTKMAMKDMPSEALAAGAQ